MKKIFISMIAVISIFSSINIVAHADNELAAYAVPSMEFVMNLFENNIVTKSVGRAGAATVDGAKGIAFEYLYCAKLNITQLFDDCYAKLSSCSIDTIADIYVCSKDGSIKELIQCKDGTSITQIKNTIKKYENGQYTGTELVGTTEFANAYNVEATEKGVALAKDSGISTKWSEKVGNKMTGTNPTTAELFNSATKSGCIGAFIGAGCALVESITNKDSLSETVSNVIVDSSVSGISCFIAPFAYSGTQTVFIICGSSVATAATASSIAAFVIPCATGYILYLLADKTDAEQAITEFTENCFNNVSVLLSNCLDF